MIFAIMDDVIEIDLRKIIQQLLKHWWQIVGSAVILAALAFLISSLLPKTYRATALVAVTQPLYQLNFDPKIQTINVQPANKVYLDLATSDDVLKQIFDQWADRPASITDLDAFRKSVIKAESGGDTSIIRLNADTASSDQSARVANLWASALIEKTNTIYFGLAQQLSFLEDQMATTEEDLDQAEKALVDFQAQNQMQVLNNQLNSALQNQSEYLAIQRNLAYLAQSVQGLHNQLTSNPGDDVTATNQINLLLLQVQAYNNQVDTIDQRTQTDSDTSATSEHTTSYVNPFPLQIQIADPAIFGNLSAREQITALDNLADSLAKRTTQVADELTALSPEIIHLQSAVEQYRAMLDQLTRTRDIAAETYTTLAQKVDEVRISEQDPSNRLRLASSALPPAQPLSRNRLRNTILAGFAGGILAIISILVWEWWRGQATPEDK